MDDIGLKSELIPLGNQRFSLLKWLSGDKRCLSGDKVPLSGDKVPLSGDKLTLSGDKPMLSGDNQFTHLPR
ncbi:hypothetical protein [Sporosarcina highlanderae]|uniref:Uncharacterized protein n=1 Tax=Sporosarcina highlanderae TaxID=3035916 RepID=A0ABT8JM08_9BACL|nr:hypothetical protein [Sporosarcina highlanderae]MDN4606188.1 hypothetical protein [Sporosarcina highlanderae]